MTQLLTHRQAGSVRPESFLTPPPLAPLSLAVALPLGLTLTVLLPAFVALHDGPGAHDTAYWVQLALACYAGARLTAMILSRGHRLFQGAFWLFCYVALGIAPLAQLVLDRVPTTPLVASREHLTLALFLVFAGCLAFDLGSFLARYRPRPRRMPPQLTVSRVGLYALVGLAFIGSGLYIVQLGGIGVFFTTRTELVDNLGEWAQTESKARTGLLRGFGTVPALLALLFVVRWLVTTPARRRPGPWLLLLLLSALNVVVNNPITNPRFWFLTAVFALLFTAVPRSIAHYRTLLLLGVVAAVLVFPYADHFRYPEGHRPVMNSDSFLEPLTRKDYDQVLMFANALGYADDGHGHTDGRQVSGALLFFVPRSIWTEKPTDTGMMVGEWMGSNNTNLSSPLWMELWLDFGALGMLAGFIALGYAGERMDRRYRMRVTAPGPHNAGAIAAVLFPLIAGYSFILIRGALLQAMTRVGVLVFCIGLIAVASSPRQRQLD